MAAGSPTRIAFAAMLAGFGLALGGCGGSDEKKSGNDITRPEYIAKVDAICKKVTRQSKPSFRRLQALVDASGTYKSRLIKAAPTLRKVSALQDSKLRRVKAIEPPTADRAQVAEITRAAAKTLTDLRKFLPFAERGDLTRLIDLATDSTGSRARVERLGTTYGFREDCFSVPLDLSDFS